MTVQSTETLANDLRQAIFGPATGPQVDGIAVVRDECIKVCGRSPSDQEAHHMLWGWTGWPSFFDLSLGSKEEQIRSQIRAVLTGEQEAE